jgi:5S rRNA maturation endonuclease (ribonuclease M5)
MYGTSPKEKLTYQKVLEKISDYDIFKYYCTNFNNLGDTFNSDLRDDKNPSCVISCLNGILIYKDFSTGESYNCFSYLKTKFSCSIKEVLNLINTDFNLGFQNFNSDVKIEHSINNNPILYNKELIEKEKVTINVNIKNFTKRELEYWKQYNISKEILDKFEVKSLNAYSINNDWFYCKSLSFCYYLGKKNNIKKYKILNVNSNNKWFSNIDKNTIQGLRQIKNLKVIDNLIITSSLKDVMTLYSIGYIAIAPSSESTIISNNAFDYIKSKSNNIIMFFDNDEAGRMFSKKYLNVFNITKEIFIDDKYGVKDPSDFVKIYGIEKLKILLKEKI